MVTQARQVGGHKARNLLRLALIVVRKAGRKKGLYQGLCLHR